MTAGDDWREMIRDAFAHKPPPKPYFVYIARSDGGDVKIGIAVDVLRRIRTLEKSGGRPLACAWKHKMLNKTQASGIESALHRQFARSRKVGEWFAADVQDVVDAANALVTAEAATCPPRPTPPLKRKCVLPPKRTLLVQSNHLTLPALHRPEAGTMMANSETGTTITRGSTEWTTLAAVQ